MKVAWITPFSEGSAIGRFSQAVTNELSKQVEVHLWVSNSENLRSTSLRVIDYNPAFPMEQWWPRRTYDFSICNFGDHLPFHRDIFEFSRKVASIAILHDYVMQHFFADYYQLALRDMNGHLQRIEALYGGQGKEVNELAKAGKAPWVWETDQIVDFPMFEDCISGALAVVTHSRFQREKVERVFPGYVQDIPLAYSINRDSPVLPREQLLVPPERLLVLTVGNVNRNKRVEQVIECLAMNREFAKKVFYVVCGRVDPGVGHRIEKLIADFKLQDTIQLRGAVSELELHSLFTAADICMNLRYPAMEGGSASLAELMLYGKAGIVTDTGVYSELPDGCVMKVRPEHEREDLARTLSTLVADPGLRETIGVRAREYAESNFTPARYCERLLQFLEQVQTVKPVLEPLNRTARILSDLNIRPDMEIVKTVARMSAEMFCGSAEEAPWNKKRE